MASPKRDGSVTMGDGGKRKKIGKKGGGGGKQPFSDLAEKDWQMAHGLLQLAVRRKIGSNE